MLCEFFLGGAHTPHAPSKSASDLFSITDKLILLGRPNVNVCCAVIVDTRR